MTADDPFVVTISDDEYEAALSIPPRPDLPPFNETRLKFILRGQSVVYGVKEDVLSRIVADWQGGLPVQNVRVAEGIRPSEGVAPKVELKFDLSGKPKEDAQGKIDYREISRIVSVEAGQVLAIKHKMKAPVHGITVTGKPVNVQPIQDIPITVGSGVEKLEQEHEIVYKAKVSGTLKYQNNVLSVLPVLDIPEDVDFKVGNIHFQGDVKVGRDILSDFVVESSGSVIVWGSVIAARIQALGNVEVRAGIIGKSRGEVVAGGDITANFVENASLSAGGDIQVRNGLIGSRCHCRGTFSITQKKSRIIETEVIAGRGIDVGIAGSQYSANTRLITGIHIEKEDEYLRTKAQVEELLKEARDIERRYGRALLENRSIPRGLLDKAQKDIARWEELKEIIRDTSAQLKTIEDEMYDYSASILVRDELYPKVFLKIGRFELTTTHEARHVTVRYSAEENRLVF